jgi:imidazolonepropionase
MVSDAGSLGSIRNGAIASKDGRIAWAGKESDLPRPTRELSREVIEIPGHWVTPGLIDCHTHLVFAGDRSGEFEARLRGSTYEEIARAGGGIKSTMKATREATEASLVKAATPRLLHLFSEGVTTVEIKSGYGLDPEGELKMLRAGRTLGKLHPPDVQTTFLGAHVVPPEYEANRQAYVELVCGEMIPAVVEEDLAVAVDAFCDEIAFTRSECEVILRAGQESGLAVRLHADQLSDQGGADLAGKLRARSADHLERTSTEGVKSMAAGGTTAVLLPGAYHFLQDDHPPPVDAFRDAGVPMAVATDMNPGSSPLNSLLTALNLACVLFGLTPDEALRGATVVGARALGLLSDRGTLTKGKMADLAFWEIDHPRELSYWVGKNPCKGVVKGGEFFPVSSLHPLAS